jgi:hypothetical protein
MNLLENVLMMDMTNFYSVLLFILMLIIFFWIYLMTNNFKINIQ